MNNLISIDIESIYPLHSSKKILLPPRMARCTPDTYRALINIRKDVHAAGGHLRLSDLFRSYETQWLAHKNKPTLSPAPGGSNHEAGRAFDIDLAVLGIPLKQFWAIAAQYGVTPIIRIPNPKWKEAWHFECLGSHAKLKRLDAKFAAISGILDLNLPIDWYRGPERDIAQLQCNLHRLSQNPGRVDGRWGPITAEACRFALGSSMEHPVPCGEVKRLVRETFPQEYQL